MWPNEAVPMLQDRFDTKDWQMFREAATEEETVNLEEYTTSVLGAEDVTTIKTATAPHNQKPWLNAEVRCLLRERDAAFWGGGEMQTH